MTSQDLKQYIFKNEKIEYILEELGCSFIDFHPDKNYYTATQPDGDNKLGVIICNNEFLGYFSYSRNINIDEHKDIFYFIGQTKKYTFAETMRYVHNLLGLKYTFKKDEHVEKIEEKYDPLSVFTKYDKKYKTRNVLDFNILNEEILNDFEPLTHISWLREGIAPWTSKKFGLCYSYKYHRQIVPIRWWWNGYLAATNARTTVENYELFDIKKYILTPGYNKSNNLYGLWENYKSIEEAGYIVIGESEKSVLKRDSLGDSTWVALSGKTLSEEQARIISGLNINEVVIALDQDVPLVEVWDICEKLFRIKKVSYIYDKHGLLGDKDSPADAKNKIYEFLYKYRVTYDENMHQKYMKSLGR